jgi:hypothetical protein
MSTPLTERAARHQAGWKLAGIALVVVVVLAAVVAVIAAHHATAPTTQPRQPRPPVAPVTTNGNIVSEDELAARPMLALPPQDAQPHPLTSQTAGPPINLPRPTATADHWIPGGFPDTTSGALGQLKTLDETAMDGGDPATYGRAYRQLSLPGAPDPGSTGLSSVLTSFRAAGGLPDTGPDPSLSVSYQVTEGLIKGSADDGRYVVACVLGELTVQDQALRWTGATWRISPGELAAPASCAWPGSVESVDAGYRELS